MGQKNPLPPEAPEEGNRAGLACVCAATMYACAAGYGGFVVWRSSPAPRVYLGVVLGLPAVAAGLFLMTALLVPGLLAPRRMAFPLNLTLPPVFAAYVLLSTVLLTSTGNSLILPYDRIRAAMFWASPAVLFLVTLSQVLCLSLLAMLKTQPVD